MNACFGDVATDANSAPLRSLSSSVLAVNVSERNINEEHVAEFPGMKQKGKSCHSRLTNSFLFVVWHSPISDTLKWHQQKRKTNSNIAAAIILIAHLVYTYIWQMPFYQIRQIPIFWGWLSRSKHERHLFANTVCCWYEILNNQSFLLPTIKRLQLTKLATRYHFSLSLANCYYDICHFLLGFWWYDADLKKLRW